jgi:hypothetical protein
MNSKALSWDPCNKRADTKGSISYFASSFQKVELACGNIGSTNAGMDTHFSRISACWLRYASNCHLDLRHVGLSSVFEALPNVKTKTYIIFN